MARNGSGTYILPTGNPVVTGTVIQSSTFNQTMTDLGNEVTNSLPRDGQAPMTAPLKVTDGTSAAPGIAFNSESSTGLSRPSTGNLAVSVGGTEVLRANSAGRVLLGTTTDDGATRLQVAGNLAASGNITSAGTITGSTVAATSLNVSGAITTTGITSSGPITLPNHVALNLSDSAGTARRFGLWESDNGVYVGDIDYAQSNSVLHLRATGQVGVDLGGSNAAIFNSAGLAVGGSGLVSSGQGFVTSRTEALRVVQDAGYISFFNSGNSARTGYLQYVAGGDMTLSNEVSTGNLRLTTAGQTMTFDRTGSLSVPGAVAASSMSAPSFTGSLSGNATSASLASKASTVAQNGGNGTAMTFNWSGDVGGTQPTWVWGGSDGINHYVYNPSNFSVNYANSAGSASTASSASFANTAASLQTARAINGVPFNGTADISLPAPSVISTGATDAAGNEVGYKGMPGNGSGMANGQCYFASGNFSVSASTAYAMCGVFNNTAGPITISASGVTMYKAGTAASVGSVTLAAHGIATFYYITANTVVVSGNVS